MLKRLIIFLILNFLALGLGSFFTTDGVASEWYATLNRAPWEPPGWVFGAAWFTIMICFSIYMAYAWERLENKKTLITLFVIQWFLNVAWNPMFFEFHQIGVALVMITSLSLLMINIAVRYLPKLHQQTWLLAPYIIWLIIATSLNIYALVYN